MALINKFEIHYFLPDGQHSMNAFLRNKCDAEFLAITNEVIKALGFDITVNAEALKEGGIRDIWKFIGKDAAQINIVLTLLLLIISFKGLPDSEMTTLQKENLKLQNEQIKQQLLKDQASLETVDTHSKQANENHKIVTRRSNFYKELNINQEVAKVGFSNLDENQKQRGKEIIIPRNEFVQFIQKSNKLPTEIDESAKIEIVAPVLRKGKAKWKGIYKEQLIDFHMDDETYKDAVLARQISFTSGNGIICALEIHRELNEVGEINITKYSVQAVLDRIENNLHVETISGKKYRRQKKLEESQTELFLNE